MVSGTESARKLDRPLALDDVLKEDQKSSDCLPCKIMGASAFFGLSAYSYFSGKAQLRIQKDKILQSGSRFGMKSRQAGITTIAMTLFGMGFWRLVN
ncbi:hypothetical protein GcC1_085007 [Golovinomyces cichoracearum]|uniref:Distal membrane-arm assembly complex protein 1-like domain-containing protein n=1 Tax=Golovinomyces cichoracearum TaxID=62708 RepID=A0A420IIG4_9PEZI|nr:hypothetical protein GcC1_085007 [Golovinomyces cichoracearum]